METNQLKDTCNGDPFLTRLKGEALQLYQKKALYKYFLRFCSDLSLFLMSFSRFYSRNFYFKEHLLLEFSWTAAKYFSHMSLSLHKSL